MSEKETRTGLQAIARWEPGFVTLDAVGMHGDWVSPIQKTSGSPTGPVLVGKHWLDADSVKPNRDVLDELGYLPAIPFNRVLSPGPGPRGGSQSPVRGGSQRRPTLALLRERESRHADDPVRG